MSKSSEYVNDKMLFGDFLPKVYIDKITLSGREDQGEEYMKVEVDIALKDSADPTGNFLLFDNHELWDLINIDVAITTDAKAQGFIQGERSIQKLAYAPIWPSGLMVDESVPGGIGLDPQYTALFEGEVSSGYWRVPSPHSSVGAWIRPELFKASWSTKNVTDLVHGRLGERPERGFVGAEDAGAELLKLLPEIAETHDNSAKVIKILTSKFTFMIHKNLLTDLEDTGYTSGTPGTSLADALGDLLSPSYDAVPGAKIFPNDLYIFAYARVNTDSEYWEGSATSAGGLDNLDEMLDLQNEFIGEVAYEHMIQAGTINFREYKYFTEDDRLYQGPLVLNTNGDYVKALEYDNERMANEIADRVLSLIDTETEEENTALIYYSYIVSNLVGYAEYPEMFFQLYQQLRLMSDRRTDTSAGKLANAFSNLMEQLKGIFLPSEIVYKKMVRNSKYFDRRVPGSATTSGIKFCAPAEIPAAGYGDSDDGLQELASCVLPMKEHGAAGYWLGPTPHSKIWLTSDIPGDLFDPSGTDMSTELVGAGGAAGTATNFDTVNADFLQKRINGWFMLNLENMMYKNLYHPTAKHFVLTKKLVHHFGFGVVSKYFFVDQIQVHRAAVDWREAEDAGGGGANNVTMPILNSTEEHVFSARVTRQATNDPGDGTDITKTATNLRAFITKPYFEPSVSSADGDATYGSSDITTGEGYYPINWFGTNNTSEKIGLTRRRTTFAPYAEGASPDEDLWGYPEGLGHYGTGLFTQVTHPFLQRNPDKIEKILFCYFSEPVLGMFGMEDCSEYAGFEHNGRGIKNIYLKYVADYTVINNIGGFCYVIWSELKKQRSVLEDYVSFAERVCSFDNRTGKFNEFFGDQLHEMFYAGLDLAWWTRPVAYYVLVEDLLNNSFAGNSALMRERTLNIIQSIDPTSGTIYALRDFLEDFNNLVASWETNFRGMHLGDKFDELAGVYTWHKNFEPREGEWSHKSPICRPSFDFPYGYGSALHGAGGTGDPGSGMPLPTGTYPITEAFKVYHAIMESVEYEQFARAQAMINTENLKKCLEEGVAARQKQEMSRLIKRAILPHPGTGTPDDLVRNIAMAPISTSNNISVNSDNVDRYPPSGHGWRSPESRQFEIFERFLEDYKDNSTTTSRTEKFIGNGSKGTYTLDALASGEGDTGMRKGAWELFMEATLASTGKSGDSTEKALAAGVYVAAGYSYSPENTPAGTSVKELAYDYQLLRERIRKGLRKYVDWYMMYLKECTGLSAQKITDRYFAGSWPFNALGHISAGPDSQNPFRGSETLSATRGWGQIDLEMREMIEDLLEGVRRLRVIGVWPVFDAGDIADYLSYSDEGIGSGAEIALEAGDDEGGYRTSTPMVTTAEPIDSPPVGSSPYGIDDD
jgi:hypothetical protein